MRVLKTAKFQVILSSVFVKNSHLEVRAVYNALFSLELRGSVA